MNYRDNIPEIIMSFITYHETIKGHSQKTVDEYFLDLRIFFRFMKQFKGLVPRGAEFDEISIADIDLDFVKSITLSDVYSFLDYLSRGRGLNANSRARKIASIRSFYKYLTVKAKLLAENPMQDLDSPKTKGSLPKYLSLEESIYLLHSIDGPNATRDYCILTLFLNCGLRISELISLNLADIKKDYIIVTGKGNKERTVFLNYACILAINDYLEIRKTLHPTDKKAFFISKKGNRMGRTTVHELVKKHLLKAGLDSTRYSSHKLRHTAATLMLQSGVDIRTLQEVLGHEHLNTTQIYTHVDSSELHIAAQANPLSGITKKDK